MKTISEHFQAQTGRDLWTDVLPLLDQAIDALPDGDRRLILLRFFERRSFREIGTLLGKSDDAVQKHTSRAVGKLARWLGRRGVTAGAAILGAGLAEAVAASVPPSLVPAVASRAVAAASSSAIPVSLLSMICQAMNTKAKASLVTGALVAVSALLWQHLEIRELRRELSRWHSQAESGRGPRSPVNPAVALRQSRDVLRPPATGMAAVRRPNGRQSRRMGTRAARTGPAAAGAEAVGVA